MFESKLDGFVVKLWMEELDNLVLVLAFGIFLERKQDCCSMVEELRSSFESTLSSIWLLWSGIWLERNNRIFRVFERSRCGIWLDLTVLHLTIVCVY